jgi:V8-like Glu-specific endopeptidase
MKWDHKQRAALRRKLAVLYPRETPQRAFAEDVGLNPSVIGFEASAESTWYNIVTEAQRQGLLDEVLSKARTEHPRDEELKRLEDNQTPEPLPAPDIASVPWLGPPGLGALEKLIGSHSALVPICHLELGLRCARPVARVALQDGSSGTGFLIAGDLLITNNHVLPNRAVAETATAQFNYQQTADGLDAGVQSFKMRPDLAFETSVQDDWTAVRMEGEPTKKWGKLELRPAKLAKDDRVNIIQHPGGGYKQLSFFANMVVFVGNNRVQYLTDTLPGSSGAPVFDRHWNVVAIHHSGGWMLEPGSTSTNTFLRNEGILIDAVLNGLEKSGLRQG